MRYYPTQHLPRRSWQRASTSAFLRRRNRLSSRGFWAVLSAIALGTVPGCAAQQQSLSLHQAVQEAMQSPAAQIADEQVRLALAQRKQSSLRPNPRLYLQSEDIRPGASNFSFANNTEDYADVAQVFEVDGKRRKRVEVATAYVHRSEAQRALQMRQIAGGVAAAYWSAAASEKIVGLLQQDLAAVDDLVRYHQERVDAGAMRGVDLIRIEIERDRIFLALQAAERDALLARIELFRSIGKPMDKNIALAENLATIDALPEIDLSTALAQRVEIDVARDQVTAAEADVRLQHANGFGDPDVAAGYKRNSGFNTIYTAVQIPLTFTNRNQGEVQRAEVQVKIARATLEQTQITVEADIAAATEGYQRQVAIVHNTLPQMRARAKQNLDILTEAYRIGGVDLLRFIDAERTSLDVEVTAIRTLAEYHQAELRLQLAYGGQP